MQSQKKVETHELTRKNPHFFGQFFFDSFFHFFFKIEVWGLEKLDDSKWIIVGISADWQKSFRKILATFEKKNQKKIKKKSAKKMGVFSN
jgi:hypothetical protein